MKLQSALNKFTKIRKLVTWTNSSLLRGMDPKKSSSFWCIEPLMAVAEIEVWLNRREIDWNLARSMSPIDENERGVGMRE